MEAVNQTLFLWINAPARPNILGLTLAIFLAEWLIWAVPVAIGTGWLRGNGKTRQMMLVATTSGLVGMLINQLVGLVWSHPRPFMIGLGHTFIPHVADSSFPSDHLTLWWATVFSVLMQQGPRRAWSALALLGISIAWARIYLGVHFPFDMLGAAVVAALSAWLTLNAAHWYLPPVYRLAVGMHRILFSRLIRLGWVRE